MAGKRVQKEQISLWRMLGVLLLIAGIGVLPPPLPQTVAAASPLPEFPAAEIPQEKSSVEGLPEIVEELPEEVVPEEPKRLVGLVPASELSADDTYFERVAFLGDSRTEGLYLYGGVEQAAYLYAVGANVESVFSRKDWETDTEEKIPLLDALLTVERENIYVMLGVNELGWPQTEMFRSRYVALLERLRADHPEANIVIQSILPVSQRQDEKGTYVNNVRINEYNAVLLELAEEMEHPYVNVAEAVQDENGCLRADLTYDGVHLNTEGCRLWLDYLRTHTI